MPILVAQRGHVPRTTGKTGTAGEQDVVRQIAAWLQMTIPSGWGLRVIDADPPDWMYGGDVFVALHCDGGDPASHGASVGYPDAAGGALAQRWKTAYVAQGWTRGFKPDNYTPGLSGYYAYDNALAQGNRVRMVVEHGFLTNAEDAAWIHAHYAQCALAIWAAVTGGNDVSGAAGYITIREGDRGPLVGELQERLRITGANLAGVQGGYFDLITTRLVRNFQTSAGLSVDGVVGPDTWAKLIAVTTPTPPPSDANEQIATLEAKLDKCAELARQILAVTA